MASKKQQKTLTTKDLQFAIGTLFYINPKNNSMALKN